MFHSKKLLWLIACSIMVGFAFVLVAHASASMPRAMRAMDGGLWRYSVERNHNTGAVLAKIAVDFADPNVAIAYKQLNQQYASGMISKSFDQARDVDVTLTFTSPLSWEDVVAIRKETGLSVQLYTFAALNEQGEKGSLTGVAGVDSSVDIRKATEIITSQGYRLQGVMMIRGKIPNTPDGLGKLMADNRIYLIDLMANRVRENLLERGDLGDGLDERIYVHAPSPFWDMDWN